jgi:tetratricopeptide (TPR) repeat protein
MLVALGRVSEAAEALSTFLEGNPSSSEAALELAEIRLKAGDASGTINVLSSVEGFSPKQQQRATYFIARSLLESGKAADAEHKLKTIKDPPAWLAADIAVALAECRLQQDDVGEADKIMETFIEENSRLPDCPWPSPARPGCALKARLRARNSAAGQPIRARNARRAVLSRQERTLLKTEKPPAFQRVLKSQSLSGERCASHFAASPDCRGTRRKALKIAQAGRDFAIASCLGRPGRGDDTGCRCLLSASRRGIGLEAPHLKIPQSARYSQACRQ